ncbi:MAG: bifunctional nicotinamidase/pyrazinamidase [Actinomycetota bacterium]|jgi:nicotinamidase/pyrazinamidase|nr:bifunctional nicotinamidase/pyrazinamidase [Actinomycetota bacterium]
MDALLLIDIQNDFMPGGALAVAHGDEVVAVANALIATFELVVATQDWHPSTHGSFALTHEGLEAGDIVELRGVQQVLWPAHCVQGSPGASFHSALDVAGVRYVVRKGTDPEIDSYSAFFDNARKMATGLAEYLGSQGVSRMIICGLATDYCVKSSALDARDLGFDVVVVSSGCRAVDLAPGDGARALEQMEAAGCEVVAEIAR